MVFILTRSNRNLAHRKCSTQHIHIYIRLNRRENRFILSQTPWTSTLDTWPGTRWCKSIKIHSWPCLQHPVLVQAVHLLVFSFCPRLLWSSELFSQFLLLALLCRWPRGLAPVSWPTCSLTQLSSIVWVRILYSVKVVSASHPSRESLLTSSREEDVPPLFEWVTNKSNNISHLLEIWIYSIFQLHFDQFQENNVFHILTLYISLSTVRD